MASCLPAAVFMRQCGRVSRKRRNARRRSPRTDPFARTFRNFATACPFSATSAVEIARAMDRICNILVVEDDDSVRALLGDILDHAGYEFTLARDGAEMRAALDAEPFDVAIIDISLRGGEDGFVLGEVASGKGCSVILTTGDPERRARLEVTGR